jgi:hypothetical protein
MSGAQGLSPNNSSGCRCFCVRLVRYFKDHLHVAVPTAGTLQAGCELIEREGLATGPDHMSSSAVTLNANRRKV